MGKVGKLVRLLFERFKEVKPVGKVVKVVKLLFETFKVVKLDGKDVVKDVRLLFEIFRVVKLEKYSIPVKSVRLCPLMSKLVCVTVAHNKPFDPLIQVGQAARIAFANAVLAMEMPKFTPSDSYAPKSIVVS